MFKVTFQYDPALRKWDVFVSGATSELEAKQGFNAVILTAQQAIPRLECNDATLQPDGTYIICVGKIPSTAHNPSAN